MSRSRSNLVPRVFREKAKSTDVGVGLRHIHYEAALTGTWPVDFVEIHAENFFAMGGATQWILNQVASTFPISLHATSLGLGSASGINPHYLKRLQKLERQIKPVLISDHASFSWSTVQGNAANKATGQSVHAGDLLPLEFSQRNLQVLINNVDHVQQTLGRSILVENVSAYIDMGHGQYSEAEFLVQLAEKTQCGLLIDLNNLLVNASNFPAQNKSPLAQAKAWLTQIPPSAIQQFHLAGFNEPGSQNTLIVDDHSQPVSNQCWDLYAFALQHAGNKPTLIEWDNNLPSWPTLVEQATQARHVQQFTIDTQEIHYACHI